MMTMAIMVLRDGNAAARLEFRVFNGIRNYKLADGMRGVVVCVETT